MTSTDDGFTEIPRKRRGRPPKVRPLEPRPEVSGLLDSFAREPKPKNVAPVVFLGTVDDYLDSVFGEVGE